MAKRCKICHSGDSLDGSGRCYSCAVAKAATDAGMTYGKFMADLISGRRYIKLEPETEEKPRKMVLRECVYCGKEFAPNNSNHLYCSRECAKKAQHLRNRAKRGLSIEEIKPIPCAYCGKEFLPHSRHKNLKFCSDECRIRAGDIRKKERKHENRNADNPVGTGDPGGDCPGNDVRPGGEGSKKEG